ncbi:hypothetical protein GW765_04330 [Candidatus Parcubacteria bacterium]|nr:hypothetical protein [Candidatus Parcubacteria bacterium]
MKNFKVEDLFGNNPEGSLWAELLAVTDNEVAKMTLGSPAVADHETVVGDLSLIEKKLIFLNRKKKDWINALVKKSEKENLDEKGLEALVEETHPVRHDVDVLDEIVWNLIKMRIPAAARTCSGVGFREGGVIVTGVKSQEEMLLQEFGGMLSAIIFGERKMRTEPKAKAEA